MSTIKTPEMERQTEQQEQATLEQIEKLKNRLAEKDEEIKRLKEQQVVVQPNSQENLLKTIMEGGIPLVAEYMKMSNEAERYNADIDAELEKEELKIINKLDTKEKIYKGILLTICLSALIVCAIFYEKVGVIIPVLSLIIGLLFRTNSLSDYFSHAKRKLNMPDNDD